MDEHALHNLDPQLVHHPLIPDLPHFGQPFDATQFVHSDFNLSEIYSSSHNHLAHHHNLNSFDLAHDFHHIGLNGFEVVEDLIRATDCLDSNQL